MYEVYAKIRDLKGMSDTDVSKAAGISRATFSHWKNGAISLKTDKLKKIADLFGVSVDYLMTGKHGNYYYEPEVARLAQEIFESPGRRILMDSSRNLSEDDLKLAISIVQRMAKNGEH